MPCAGTREALFHLALAAVPEWQGQGPRPAVLMPSPFYHVYAGAAAVAGAEPVFLPATPANGFLPEPESVDSATLARTALAYVCSPANPQGAVASRDYLARWIRLARAHNFAIAFDECYAEIYRGQPPAGALEAAEGRLDNVIVLHSLSKRSAAPGLRSGFIAGDRRLVKRVTQLVNFGGSAPSFPALAASAALWREESHVEAGRERYRRSFAVAERLLGKPLRLQPPRPAASSSGSTWATARPRPSASGPRRACASSPALTWPGRTPKAATPARPISESPWCMSRRWSRRA